jgi:hypothetical protein
VSDFDRSDDHLTAEKFTPSDLTALRTELLQSSVDTFQAGEILTSFLSGRGYGISSHEARRVASKIERAGCKPEHIHAELERVARVM